MKMNQTNNKTKYLKDTKITKTKISCIKVTVSIINNTTVLL